MEKKKLVLGGEGADLEILIGPGIQTLLPPSWTDGVRREWVEGEELFPEHVAAIPRYVLEKLGCRLDRCDVARQQDVVGLCQAGGGYRETETASVSLLSLSSLSLCNPDKQAIVKAIQHTRPSSTGHRQRCIFVFARHLKAIPAIAKADAKTLRPIIQEWYKVALPYIATKEFDETWADFCTAWEKVKFPLGQGPVDAMFEQAMNKPLPPEAEAYGTDSLRNLVALCAVLQLNAGSEPFYLTCRTAGQILGISHKLANKWLRQLERDGVLEITEHGSQNRATRYRYLGSQQEQ